MNVIDKIEHIQTKQTPSMLRFCTLTEQEMIRQRVPTAQFYGGYHNPERKRVFLFTDVSDNITCFRMTYDTRYLTVTHSNILGTLMSLSITYDSIGDILPDQNVFFTTSEIAAEIQRSFTAINHVPVTLDIIDGQSIKRTQTYSSHQLILASLRLDLVVAKIAHISRSDAQTMIQSDLIKRNHLVIAKPTITLVAGDVLSIRKHGRFVLDDANGRTKKGKIILKYRKYE